MSAEQQNGRATVELRNDIDLFLAEFAAAELDCAGVALRSLADDAKFVEHTEAMLDPAARFRLIERMAFVRKIDPTVIKQIETAGSHAQALREKRDAIADTKRRLEEGTGTGGDAWVPTRREIENCRVSTRDLHATLLAIARQVTHALATERGPEGEALSH